MRVYRFAYADGRYLGPVELGDGDRDPLNLSRFLIPGDCTLLAPPSPPRAHCFIDGAWRRVDDNAAKIEAAHALLKQTDLVALRCFKLGLAYPAAWRAFDAALEALIAAPAGAPLPALPPLPPMPFEFGEISREAAR